MFKTHRLTLLFLAFCAIFVGMTGGAYYFDQEQARAGGFVRYSDRDQDMFIGIATLAFGLPEQKEAFVSKLETNTLAKKLPAQGLDFMEWLKDYATEGPGNLPSLILIIWVAFFGVTRFKKVVPNEDSQATG